jgi:hypothetical protein
MGDPLNMNLPTESSWCVKENLYITVALTHWILSILPKKIIPQFYKKYTIAILQSADSIQFQLHIKMMNLTMNDIYFVHSIYLLSVSISTDYIC